MSSNQPRPKHAAKSWSVHESARRRTVLIPIVAMLLATMGIWFTMEKLVPDPASKTCVANDASLIIPQSGALLGVNLDWHTESLAQYAASIGHAPAVAVQFSDFPYDRKTWQHTVDAARQVKANGGAMLLTLEPHAGLAAVSPQVIAQLVIDLKALNDEGVPVILRYAHEMNGSWYAWGQQPAEYVASFRRVAAAVHKSAPGTSMLWAPNYGGGYPFEGGRFQAKRGTYDYSLLDTNGDGAVTSTDDPYAPYYPGDDAVDWVGISLYHWGNKRPWGDNDPLTETNKFSDMLTGNYRGTAGNDLAVPNFYHVYGVEHHKPIAITETAAIYTPARGGTDELSIKQAWWRQIFNDSFTRKFPQVKMINWFEWKKFEIEIHDTVDWRSAGNPRIRKAYVADLPPWLHYAQDVHACRKSK